MYELKIYLEFLYDTGIEYWNRKFSKGRTNTIESLCTQSVSNVDRRSFDHPFGRLHDQDRSLVAETETLIAHSHPGPAIDCLSLIRSTVHVLGFSVKIYRITETLSLVRLPIEISIASIELLIRNYLNFLCRIYYFRQNSQY